MAVTSISDGSATISTTEYSLIGAAGAAAALTTAGYVMPVLDVSQLAAGDVYRLRVKDKVNAGGGGVQRVLWEGYVAGAQPQNYGPTMPTMVLSGWDVTVTKVAGTDRTIGWSVRLDDSGVTIGALATDAISAGALSAGAASKIATAVAAPSAAAVAAAVWALALEGSSSAADLARGVARFLLGKRSGMDAGTVKIRDLANTKDSITIVQTTDAWTSVTRDLT